MRLTPAILIACVSGALLGGVPLSSRPPVSPRADRRAAVNAPCSDLAALTLAATTITSASQVEAGAFTPPTAANAAAPAGAAARAFAALPAFCRVVATLAPSTDSDITIEVWMPAASWNGKLQAVGNGAFNGSIPYTAMAAALARGYATAATDTGHTGGSARFGLGHPEKVIDFGWRAVHEMTVAAKAIIGRHYTRGPQFSYWNGCSAGGRQAMKAAQRFPADFDGIIAGAPGLDWTGRAAEALRIARHLEDNADARLLEADRQLLHRAVLTACDANDGVKDGVIENPAACRFDPAALQCKSSDSIGCLSGAQVESARMIYAGALNPQSKRLIAGLVLGSELGWTDLGWTASARATGLEQFRFLVFGDPAWDIARFDFAADIVRAEARDADTINALDPNLKPFLDRSGKLLQYHGWSDTQISPLSSVQYYTRVISAIGGADRVPGSYRLFMAPGMGHCSGGEGPDAFDAVAALEEWVERGRAPEHIVATRVRNGNVERSRPLCPYPQVAVYKGVGSTDETTSFVCRANR